MTINNKYPLLLSNYESTNNINLFFIGSLMHSIDYKKSSGGFIHGFRYLIKLFTQINYKIPFNIMIFNKNDEGVKSLAKYMYNRTNTTSSLYQMYGIMLDAFYTDNNNIIYYNDLTLSIAMTQINRNIFNFIHFTYGDKKNTDLTTISKFNKYDPQFLHYEIIIFDKNTLDAIDRIIFEEELVADFTHIKYYEKILRTLYSIT